MSGQCSGQCSGQSSGQCTYTTTHVRTSSSADIIFSCKSQSAPQTLFAHNINTKQLASSGLSPISVPSPLQQPWWLEMLHAVAGLCSVALPDMEETAVYSSLTRSGSKTIILTAQHTGPTPKHTDPSPQPTGPTPQSTDPIPQHTGNCLHNI